MEAQSLWGNIEPVYEHEVINLLKEQGKLLGRETQNTVIGTLKYSGNLKDFLPEISYNFYLQAPHLNYEYLLLSLQFNTNLESDLYPFVLKYKDYTFEVLDKNSFVEHLKKIFQDSSTQKVIQNLMRYTKNK